MEIMNTLNWQRNNHTKILSIYAFLFVLTFVGIRFESPLPNYIVVAFLLTAPLGVFLMIFFGFNAHTTSKKVIKMASLAILAVATFFCSLFLLWHILAIGFLIKDGGVDQSKIEIARVNISGFTDIVAYQTNGGATTDFGTIIYKETSLFSALKIMNRIGGAYHTNDILLENVEGEIILKDINFTNLMYEQEYYNEGGTLRDGMVLEI